MMMFFSRYRMLRISHLKQFATYWGKFKDSWKVLWKASKFNWTMQTLQTYMPLLMGQLVLPIKVAHSAWNYHWERTSHKLHQKPTLLQRYFTQMSLLAGRFASILWKRIGNPIWESNISCSASNVFSLSRIQNQLWMRRLESSYWKDTMITHRELRWWLKFMLR